MDRRILPKYNDHDYLLKIVLIGDAAVGKSSLLFRYIDDIYEDNYTCTIGVDFKIKTIDIQNKRVKLQIWDTAGQERFRPITSCYFRGAHGCLAVYDITNRESFMHVRTWIHEFREQNKIENEKNVILIANKKDAEELRTVSFQEGQELAQAIGANFLEASAKSGFKVPEMFVTLAEDILSKSKVESVTRREITRPTLQGASIDVSGFAERPYQQKKCLC